MKYTVIFCFVVLSGIVCGGSEPPLDCPKIDIAASLGEAANPAALLEEGHYLFADGKPIPKECVHIYACQVNEYTRQHFGQSYYISLSRPGGKEIERQFPEVVASIVESRGPTRVIYLNNFCRELASLAADPESDGHTIK